jgi:hypothetical protein
LRGVGRKEGRLAENNKRNEKNGGEYFGFTLDGANSRHLKIELKINELC